MPNYVPQTPRSIPEVRAELDKVAAAVESVLHRDGTSPNQMESDLDMNGNDILNALFNGEDIQDVVDDAKAATVAANDAATNANDAADNANQTAVEVALLAEQQREQFEETFTAQFTYLLIGNISDFVGDVLQDEERLNAYQYPDDSGEWYGPIQSQTFPITIPADPTVDSGWASVRGFTREQATDIFANSNLLSNHNFLIQTPDNTLPLPSSTPTNYPANYQIFSGVFANATTGITGLTYVNGRVSFTSGDLYFAIPNTDAISRLTTGQLTASVADFDGKPRTRGVSLALVGDEYRVTVGVDALEDVDLLATPLGSVKLEQGALPTYHEVDYAVEDEFKSMGDFLSGANIRDSIVYKVVSFYDGWAVDSLANYLPSGGGEFVLDSSRDKSEHNGITVISPTVPFGTSLTQRDAWLSGTGETDPSGKGCLVRVFEGEVNMLWSGATRANVDDNKTPINSVIALSLSQELPVYVPKGDYRSSERILFNLAATPNRRMPEWRGDGPYTSNLRSSSTVSPSISVFGSAAGPDHFQGKLTRLGFSADTPNVAFSFGLDDLSDNLGNFTIDQCFFGNSNATSSMTAVSLRCNWMFDCEFRNIVVVGRPNAGTALDARQLHFSHFLNGSYSNAYFGINFQDGGTAFCHGVTFTVPDIENVTVGAFCNQPSVRAITFDNPFIDVRDPVANNEPLNGAMFDWRDSDISGLTVNNVDPARSYSFLYGGTAFSPQTNFSRVNVTGRYPNQVDPAVPASDAAYFNNTGQAQRVEVFGGTVTDIFINGEARGNPNGPYTVVLNSGEFIAIRYSAVPNWRWKALL